MPYPYTYLSVNFFSGLYCSALCHPLIISGCAFWANVPEPVLRVCFDVDWADGVSVSGFDKNMVVRPADGV